MKCRMLFLLSIYDAERDADLDEKRGVRRIVKADCLFCPEWLLRALADVPELLLFDAVVSVLSLCLYYTLFELQMQPHNYII